MITEQYRESTCVLTKAGGSRNARLCPRIKCGPTSIGRILKIEEHSIRFSRRSQSSRLYRRKSKFRRSKTRLFAKLRRRQWRLGKGSAMRSCSEASASTEQTSGSAKTRKLFN